MRFLFFLFLFMASRTAFAEEWVRVKLWSEDKTSFSIQGAVHRLQGHDSPLVKVALPQNQNLKLRWDQERWIVEGFKNHPLVFKEKYLVLEGPALLINQKKVPDKIILSREKKAIQVIGILPLEKYVMGVLAHEMPAQWPLETLKAQAIATRSYTLAMMKERSRKSYHLESSVLDQVYGFLTDEELNSRYNKIVAAVQATQGQFLVSSKKIVLKAYYHADCGGETASTQEVWTTKDELVSVTDSSCPQNPKARWSLNLSDSEISRRLKKWAPRGAQSIINLKPVGASGRLRVAQVQVTWDQGSAKTVEASLFREAMGFFDFKSTQFKVLNEGRQWLFEGRGFGHGSKASRRSALDGA